MNREYKKQGTIIDDPHSDVSSDQSDDDDYVDDLPPEQIKKMRGTMQRTSVSAEAFGQWNKKEDYKPIIIAKSEEVKKK